MCGIAGFWNNGADETQEPEVIASRMGSAIAHRGPNDHGVWSDPLGGPALAHRRLSIVDLSPSGHQPMLSPSGRFVLVYNGEIYNYRDLRQQLEQTGQTIAWHGHSDTEVLLACIEAWGLIPTLRKCIGMFAFVLWDSHLRTLTLARDRLGEKPLYYGLQNDSLLFGSELKALKAHPSFLGEIDRNALTLLMRYCYIPAPYTIYRDIYKLLPGCTITFPEPRAHAKPSPYWNAKEVIENGLANPFQGSPEEAVDALETLLKDAIAKQMVADVPLGVFLSGGIDSSSVVALMQAQSSQPVRTFSIGLNEASYNEAKYARAVAEHLGTDHTELYVTHQEALDIIPRLPTLYCEPFADSSQIPTFLVSQMAKRHVTVSLSGDGGDELFGGYNRYVLGARLWDKLSIIPTPIRRGMAKGITSVPPAMYDRVLDPLQKWAPNGFAHAYIGDKLHKGARVMSASNSSELYQLLTSQWTVPESIIREADEPTTLLTNPAQQPHTNSFVHRMMAMDLLSYLPDDILCKVDRAAMAVSLETRVPFLDHRIVEFAWSLPLDYKLRKSVGKWPLRQVLYRYVPKNLVERPKMGFGIPIDTWLRGPLRDWAEELLEPIRLRQEGYFNPIPIQQKWTDLLSEKHNWQHHLWVVLMFQAWLSAQKQS